MANVMRLVVFLAGLLAGCTGLRDGGPVAVPASDVSPAQVVISAHLPAPLSVHGLTVHLDDGARRWTVRGEELGHASRNVWRGVPQATASEGTLRVRYVLTAPDASVVSEGRIELPLKADWVHGVDIHAANEDPRRYCMGCLGSVRFPLAPEGRSPDADAIYVVWGGNSNSSPVVY